MTTASSIQPDAVAASEKKMKSPCTRCFKNCSCIQQCPTRDVNYRYGISDIIIYYNAMKIF